MSKSLINAVIAAVAALVLGGCVYRTINVYPDGAVYRRVPDATAKVETGAKTTVLENKCGKGFKPPNVPPPPKGKTVEVECVPDK